MDKIIWYHNEECLVYSNKYNKNLYKIIFNNFYILPKNIEHINDLKYDYRINNLKIINPKTLKIGKLFLDNNVIIDDIENEININPHSKLAVSINLIFFIFNF